MPPWRIQHESHTCSEPTFANSDVECILRAKTLQLYLTGMGRCEHPRKNHEATIASARCNKLEADTSLSTKPNRSPFDRLRQQCSKNWKLKNPNDRRAGSRLSRLPLTTNGKLQVRLDGQSRYPALWPSFVELGQSQSAQFPCKKRTTLKYYISSDGSHTRQEWIIIWSGRNWILKHAD